LYEILIIINTNNGDLMYKKIIYLVIIVFIIYIVRFISLRYINNDYYVDLYNKKSTKYVYGIREYRGRILDTNGRVIVDNKKINVITYRLINNPDTTYLIDLSIKLSKILNITEEASLDELKKFYLETEDTSSLVSEDDYYKYKHRIISYDELEQLKYDNLTSDKLNYNLKTRIAIHIYYLLNKGYYYDTKVLERNVSNEVCDMIEKENIAGLECDYTYERDILVDSLKSIIGSISLIPKEDYDTYISKGYLSLDYVGISGLEKHYEDTLHGSRDKYILNKDNSLSLVSKGEYGSDLYLNIDLNIQEELVSIQKKYLSDISSKKNTKYFKENLSIVGSPDGKILAISGMDTKFNDVTKDIILNSYTVGSVIKGASNTVAYLNNVIDINRKIKDSCVKLKNIPKKCSFKSLGYINDISALKYSSNYYQFINAIKVSGNTYKYNMNLTVTEEDFNKYRDIFKLYGLGSSTGIDYYKESIGIKGKTISSDLYLNLSIGQYDTYTPLQLLNYINTIALRGIRYKLMLAKGNIEILNEVGLDNTYMNRIIEGLKEVVTSGTGKNYFAKELNGAGKTGTAESYYDKDTTTINTSFIGFFPSDNPKYSIVVVSPNISYETKKFYNYPLNKYIVNDLSSFLENYEN